MGDMIRSNEFNDKINEIIRLRSSGISLTGLRIPDAVNKELKELTWFIDEHYQNPTSAQRLYHIIEDLYDVPICQFCKDDTKKFHRLNSGYFNTCGAEKCKTDSKISSFKKTISEKYGDSFFKPGSKERNRYISTMLQNYGVDHNFKSKEIQDSIKSTMVNKYGVEIPLCNKEILDKRNNTCMNKYGTLNFVCSEKAKSTNLIKFGFENAMKNSEISKKVSENSSKTKRLILSNKLINFGISLVKYDRIRSEFFCNSCGSNFINHPVTVNSKLRFQINPCTKCNPPDFTTSKMERELSNFISSVYNGEIINNCKTLFSDNPKFSEVDVYLPDLKIAFEFNGLYWHSEIYKDKKYHNEKSEYLLNKGIRLYHVWEDDWIYKNDIIKSRILSTLGVYSNILYGRKCKVDYVNPIDYKKFCESNHLKGYSPASLILGLYNNNNLVSVASFAKTRKMIDSKNTSSEYELIRSCTLKNTLVIGGVSKLIKNFLQNISGSLVTYCDSSFSPDPISTSYFKSGLNYIKSTDPGYYWCIDGRRSNRLNWTKAKLISLGYSPDETAEQIMNSLGYYKIWDCGNHKFSTSNS